MSRVGQSPIPIPDGVEVRVNGQSVLVKGPKGELNRSVPKEITVKIIDQEVRVTRTGDSRDIKALHGLIRTLIANMITGVVQGYEKRLEIHGVGYRATKQGTALEFAVGFSHVVRREAPEGIEFDLSSPTKISVRGIDKELVGQTAAEIRSIRKPEPYKAKGIRYEGEYIRRKAGKAAKAAG
jgi:large subunit ribosomal protein L6